MRALSMAWVILLCLVVGVVGDIVTAPPALAGFEVEIVDNFTCPSDHEIGDTDIVKQVPSPNDDGVFGFVLKVYQTALYTAMAQGYCAVRDLVKGPLSAAMLMAVVIFAISFMMGITKFSIREAMVLVFKLSLVIMFALNAQLAMAVIFKFFLGLTTDMIGWLNEGSTSIDFSSPDSDFGKFAAYFDDPDPKRAPCAQQVLLFFSVFAVVFPVLGAPLVLMIMTFVMLFVRAILGFLTALGALSLLMATAPLFIAFALFRTTYGFFDRWLKSMTSYSLQMMLVFFIFWACIGMFDFYGMFTSLERTLAPVPDDQAMLVTPMFGSGSFKLCTPCIGFKYQAPEIGFDKFSCAGGKIGERGATGVALGDTFTSTLKSYAPYVVANITYLLMLLWGVMELLMVAPMMAYSLAGDSSAMSLGGRVGRSAQASGREEQHSFDLGGIDKRMDNFAYGFRFGFDPSFNREVKDKIKVHDPKFGETDSFLFAPVERLGQGLKMGASMAGSEHAAEQAIQMLPQQIEKLAETYTKQANVEKISQTLKIMQSDIDGMRLSVDRGEISEALYESKLANLAEVQNQMEDAKREMTDAETEYMKTINVMEAP